MIHYLYSKDGFTYGHFIQYKMLLFVYIYIDLLKLKAYKLFENSDADLSWIFFFIRSQLVYWRGHQISPTVVSLKSRLPQKLQSQSTLSCEIVQIHGLFRHGFIKKPKSKSNRN